MKVIVLANNKGGVGKTTSVLNIAYALNQRGKSVLLIDCDQQGNLTQSFTYAPSPTRTLGPLLLGLSDVADVVQELADGLYLIPSGPGLNDAAAKRSRLPGAELVLRKILSVAHGIDYCLIDTPGSLGTLTDAALTAADAVFIPAQPEAFGVEGLVELYKRCQLVQDGLNPRLKVGGLFFTQYARNDRRRVQRDTVALLEGHALLGPLVMQRTIRTSVALVEEVTEKKNIYHFAPESNGAVDYAALTSELLLRLDDE